jgi:hypothetical protein
VCQPAVRPLFAIVLAIGWWGRPCAAEPAYRITDEQRRFWSFQPVRVVTPPTVRDATWSRSPIDRFILAALEAKGLKPAPAADKRTLIRRATFDLTGLPPEPEEIYAFLTDDSPQAFERVVDRLLASPAYGERWGRHWLDLVRYTDSFDARILSGAGNVMDIPAAWRYRDWVVSALNRDLPYDQFVQQQIAGDIAPKKGSDPLNSKGQTPFSELTATGFLAIGNWGGGDADKEKLLTDIVDDQIDVVSRALLGVTLSCARCHDHKFDPFSTADYYGLAGIFFSTHILPNVGPKTDGPPMLRIPLEKPVPVPASLGLLAGGQYKPPPSPFVHGAQEGGVPGSPHAGTHDVAVHMRGRYDRLAELVPRRFPIILAGDKQPPITQGSGRLELARWIASPENPLTARVMVNRLWQHHFGEGIVRTPSNFGKLGERPTHPELLDYLARQLVESGWSLKQMHRAITLTATYQQGSSPRDRDPENRLFGRMNRRRLEAEAVRDSLLFVAGRLDRTLGGPATRDFNSPRRTLYQVSIRSDRSTFRELFDAADTTAIIDTRAESTVAPQALFLLNHPFVREQAKSLAARVMREADDEKRRIERLYVLLYGRPPREREAEIGRETMRRLGLDAYCHLLMCANELIYVD